MPRVSIATKHVSAHEAKFYGLGTCIVHAGDEVYAVTKAGRQFIIVNDGTCICQPLCTHIIYGASVIIRHKMISDVLL